MHKSQILWLRRKQKQVKEEEERKQTDESSGFHGREY
jgi:hypothetical protein